MPLISKRFIRPVSSIHIPYSLWGSVVDPAPLGRFGRISTYFAHFAGNCSARTGWGSLGRLRYSSGLGGGVVPQGTGGNSDCLVHAPVAKTLPPTMYNYLYTSHAI